MSRAIARMELKALDTDQRTIEGWASRPECDRSGDIVESTGATYRLPIPLLMDHDHRSAVGEVVDVSVSEAGIRFRAKIAKIAEPGAIKDLCDSAWSAAKAGLRRAVSIGFRPLEIEPLATGGMRYRAWEWFELSLVSVPACAGATIDQIKSIDRELRQKARAPHRVVRLDVPVGKASLVANADRSVARAIESASKSVVDDMNDIRELGPTNAMIIRSIAAGAKATDRELAALRARIERMDGKA